MPYSSVNDLSVTEYVRKGVFLLGVIIPAAGLFYNVKYYKGFDIEIISFIDLSESLMMFIPKMMILGLILFVATLPVVYLLLSFRIRSKWFRLVGVIYLIWSIWVLWYPYTHPAPKLESEFDLFYYSIWSIISVPIITSFFRKWLRRYVRYLKYPALIYICIISAVTINWVCILNTENVRGTMRYRSVQVTLEDKSFILTDTCSIYIGQTKHYFFTWEKDSHNATVYNIDKAKHFEFHR